MRSFDFAERAKNRVRAVVGPRVGFVRRWGGSRSFDGRWKSGRSKRRLAIWPPSFVKIDSLVEEDGGWITWLTAEKCTKRKTYGQK